MRDGTTILNLEQSVKKADGLEECPCGRYFPACDVIKSDDLPGSKFCSARCCIEAEQGAKAARITDINPRAY